VRRHPILGRVALALASAALTLGVLEAGLRVAGYRFSPVLFVPARGLADFRAFHLETDGLVTFDPELLWRPNPERWADMDEDGLRVLRQGRPGETLVLVVGDSNTIGAPGSGEHWTADLQTLLDRNAPVRPIRVANAGCVGWSSLQGLRRFRQLLPLRPALALFAFGANEAHRGAGSDSEYAARAAWLARLRWSLLAPPVAHRLWALQDGRRSGELRPRGGTDEHRAHLQAFVDEARAHGATPVLVTRPYVGGSTDPGYWISRAPHYRRVTREVAAEKGATCLDAYRELASAPELFRDDSHFNRRGRHRMAVLLLRHLKGLGLVRTDFAYEPGVEPGRVEDTRPELGPGWWAAESWEGRGPGRWTAGEAVLYLERHADEDRLDVELTLFSPRNATTGRIEVNGRSLAAVSGANGPWKGSLDLGPVTERELTVRFVTDAPYVPRELVPGSRDARVLGVMVHSARLRKRR